MRETVAATASSSATSRPRRTNRHTTLVDEFDPTKIKLKHLVFLAARKNPDITDLQYYGEYASRFMRLYYSIDVLGYIVRARSAAKVRRVKKEPVDAKSEPKPEQQLQEGEQQTGNAASAPAPGNESQPMDVSSAPPGTVTSPSGDASASSVPATQAPPPAEEPSEITIDESGQLHLVGKCVPYCIVL